jgi:hypothetical protein
MASIEFFKKAMARQGEGPSSSVDCSTDGWPAEISQRYERIDALGKGSFGMVWMARRVDESRDEFYDEYGKCFASDKHRATNRARLFGTASFLFVISFPYGPVMNDPLSPLDNLLRQSPSRISPSRTIRERCTLSGRSPFFRSFTIPTSSGLSERCR